MNDDHYGIARLSSFACKSLWSKKKILNLKGEALYICIVCFVANSLSSIALDVGSRAPLGHASGSLFFIRRSYNLKITVSVSSVVSGLLATTLMAIGDKSGIPYLYLPWLVNTMRGIAFCEGPALMGIAYILLPSADLPASSFLFITLLLYVEELFLWNEVLRKFRKCWAKYNAGRKLRQVDAAETEFGDVKKRSERQTNTSVKHSSPVDATDATMRTESVGSFRKSDAYSNQSDEPKLSDTLPSTSPTRLSEFLIPTKAMNYTRRPRRPNAAERNRCTSVTG